MKENLRQVILMLMKVEKKYYYVYELLLKLKFSPIIQKLTKINSLLKLQHENSIVKKKYFFDSPSCPSQCP